MIRKGSRMNSLLFLMVTKYLPAGKYMTVWLLYYIGRFGSIWHNATKKPVEKHSTGLNILV